MKKRSAQEQKLADDARLLRAWKKWQREQLAEALQGPHGPMLERLVWMLKSLTIQSGPLLLAYIRGIDWSAIDPGTRYIVLHEINVAIIAMRERAGLAPFDDPLPGQRENISRLIKQTLFPATAGASPEPMPVLKTNRTIERRAS